MHAKPLKSVAPDSLGEVGRALGAGTEDGWIFDLARLEDGARALHSFLGSRLDAFDRATVLIQVCIHFIAPHIPSFFPLNWRIIAHACTSISTPIATVYDALGPSGLMHSLNEPSCAALLPTVLVVITHANLVASLAYLPIAHILETNYAVHRDADWVQQGEDPHRRLRTQLRRQHQGLPPLHHGRRPAVWETIGKGIVGQAAKGRKVRKSVFKGTVEVKSRHPVLGHLAGNSRPERLPELGHRY
ncbi:hypothetical protein C8R45DRAFT_1107090 [Mycena sanguinolenta]|nr:hypothetical protein C8R45DRAFT_1107090 [Mycena sanguinolenta]